MEFKEKSDEALVNDTYNVSERASIEMMRRLKDMLEKSGEQEERFSMAFLILGFVQVIIALLQFSFDVQSSEHKILGLVSMGIMAAFIAYIIFSFEKIRKEREKKWQGK